MDVLGEPHYYHRRKLTENTQKKIKKKSKPNSKEKHQNTREKTKKRLEQIGATKTTGKQAIERPSTTVLICGILYALIITLNVNRLKKM